MISVYIARTRHKRGVIKEREKERRAKRSAEARKRVRARMRPDSFVVCKCELPAVFSLVLFDVLMLIGRLPIQRPFVCSDCRFDRPSRENLPKCDAYTTVSVYISVYRQPVRRDVGTHMHTQNAT